MATVTWNSPITNKELRIALMTRIIIANNIREIRVIRSSLKLHIIKLKVQSSKFKANMVIIIMNFELWILNSELSMPSKRSTPSSPILSCWQHDTYRRQGWVWIVQGWYQLRHWILHHAHWRSHPYQWSFRLPFGSCNHHQPKYFQTVRLLRRDWGDW